MGWGFKTLAVRIALLGVFLLSLSISRSAEEEASVDWRKEQQFWSFQQPVGQAQPRVRDQNWPAQRIDYFILFQLEEKGIGPSPPASKQELVRRLTFDLSGLPPTPAEVRDFVNDGAPDAYSRLVERLLASPRFGERMTSLWLPLARYAEDQAHQVGSDTKHFYPNAYRYREWVIGAFNRNLPYDQFLKLQLAADKMDEGLDDLAALGFVGLGAKYYNRNRLEVLATEYEDRVDTVTRTMLGLTVACARCHDHKFEPIPTEDYYAIAGVFAGTKLVNKSPSGKLPEKDGKNEKMPEDVLHIVEDGEPVNLNVFIRGDVERKGPVVERRFLRILSEDEPERFTHGSGRLDLADQIASPENPLTARVFVNRVWAMLFGSGLVPTLSNFGHSGQPPTHPELLDDLAVRFMANGWSTKRLIREIVHSTAYRQTSHPEVKPTKQSGTLKLAAAKKSNGLAADPANQLLWHMNRKRLSIEQWRDSILAVSDQLELEGGKSLELDDPKNNRRTVHARISRLKLNDMLMQFDYPDANVHAEGRAETTTPMQKLFVLNSAFVLGQVKALAERLEKESPGSDLDRIRHVYQLLFGRDPSKAEIELALAFLEQAGNESMTPWEQYAQALLASNEMLYVD